MSEWIPTSERVPEDDRYVLLSFETFDLPAIGCLETYEDGSRAWNDDFEKTFAQRGICVNAWMELPKPYRGE